MEIRGYALQGGSPDVAYEAMNAIPEDSLGLPAMFKLSLIANALPDDSDILTGADDVKTPLDLSMQWQNRLREHSQMLVRHRR